MSGVALFGSGWTSAGAGQTAGSSIRAGSVTMAELCEQLTCSLPPRGSCGWALPIPGTPCFPSGRWLLKHGSLPSRVPLSHREAPGKRRAAIGPVADGGFSPVLSPTGGESACPAGPGPVPGPSPAPSLQGPTETHQGL